MSATRFQDGAILYCRLKGIVSAKIDKLKVYFAEQMDLVAECWTIYKFFNFFSVT